MTWQSVASIRKRSNRRPEPFALCAIGEWSMARSLGHRVRASKVSPTGAQRRHWARFARTETRELEKGRDGKVKVYRSDGRHHLRRRTECQQENRHRSTRGKEEQRDPVAYEEGGRSALGQNPARLGQAYCDDPSARSFRNAPQEFSRIDGEQGLATGCGAKRS
jgi:hypothetical protein